MFSRTAAPARELGTLTRSRARKREEAFGSVQPRSAPRRSWLLGPGVTSRQSDTEGTVADPALALLKVVSSTGHELSVHQ